jgi:hypothetical protein
MSKEEWFSFIFLYFLCGVLWSRGGQCDEKDISTILNTYRVAVL